MFVNWNKVRSALDKTSGCRWYVVEARTFTEKEKSIVESIKVVSSQYGLSMSFHLTNGDTSYIPIDMNTNFSVGDSPSVDTLVVLTLFRSYNDGYINRITDISSKYTKINIKKTLLNLWFRENIGAYIYHKFCIPIKKLDYKIHHKKYSMFEDLYLY